MKDNAVATTRAGSTDAPGVHTAALRIRAGSASVDGDVAISTRGLLAVGGMVSGILLSVAVLVLAATRKLPDDTLPPGHEAG
jgi:hypothetical protein